MHAHARIDTHESAHERKHTLTRACARITHASCTHAQLQTLAQVLPFVKIRAFLETEPLVICKLV